MIGFDKPTETAPGAGCVTRPLVSERSAGGTPRGKGD